MGRRAALVVQNDSSSALRASMLKPWPRARIRRTALLCERRTAQQSATASRHDAQHRTALLRALRRRVGGHPGNLFGPEPALSSAPSVTPSATLGPDRAVLGASARTQREDFYSRARSVAPWLRGSVAPWLRGSVAPWLRGSVAPWLRGSVAPWMNRRDPAQLVVGSLRPGQVVFRRDPRNERVPCSARSHGRTNRWAQWGAG
jgi:hypothetical protein